MTIIFPIVGEYTPIVGYINLMMFLVLSKYMVINSCIVIHYGKYSLLYLHK